MDPQDRRDLLKGEVLEVVQRQDKALALVQTAERFSHHRQERSSLGRVFAGSCTEEIGQGSLLVIGRGLD